MVSTRRALFAITRDSGSQFTVDAHEVRDRVGNSLSGGDVLRTFGVGTIVREPTIRWINAAGGSWGDPANWDIGALAEATGDVLIDVPDGVTITFDSPRRAEHNSQPRLE